MFRVIAILLALLLGPACAGPIEGGGTGAGGGGGNEPAGGSGGGGGAEDPLSDGRCVVGADSRCECTACCEQGRGRSEVQADGTWACPVGMMDVERCRARTCPCDSNPDWGICHEAGSCDGDVLAFQACIDGILACPDGTADRRDCGWMSSCWLPARGDVCVAGDTVSCHPGGDDWHLCPEVLCSTCAGFDDVDPRPDDGCSCACDEAADVVRCTRA